jgi:hypothetical protein
MASGLAAAAFPSARAIPVEADEDVAAAAALVNVQKFDFMAFWQDKVSIKEWNNIKKTASDLADNRSDLADAVEKGEGGVMVMRKLKERGLTASAACEVVLEHRAVFASWPQTLSESILTSIMKKAGADDGCDTALHILRGENADADESGPVADIKTASDEQRSKLQRRLFGIWFDARRAKTVGKASLLVSMLPADLGQLSTSSAQTVADEFVGGWCREMRIDALVLRACALIEEKGLGALGNVERECLGPVAAHLQQGSLRLRLMLKAPEMAATWAKVTRASREVLDGQALMGKVNDVATVADNILASLFVGMSIEGVCEMQKILESVSTGIVGRLLADLGAMNKRGVELAAEGEKKLRGCISDVLAKASSVVDWPVLERVADTWHEQTNDAWQEMADSVKSECRQARLACQVMAAFDDGNALVYVWLADCWQLWEAASGPSQAAEEGEAVSMAAYMGVWPCCDMPSVLLMHHVLSRMPPRGASDLLEICAKMVGSAEKVLSAIDHTMNLAIGDVALKLYNQEYSEESLVAHFSADLIAEVNKLAPTPWPRLAQTLARWKVLPQLRATVKQAAVNFETAGGSMTLRDLQGHIEAAIWIRSGQVRDLPIIGVKAGEDSQCVVDALKSAVQVISEKYLGDLTSMDTFLKDTEGVLSAIALWSFDGVEEWFESDSVEQHYVQDAVSLVQSADSAKQDFDGLRALTLPQVAWVQEQTSAQIKALGPHQALGQEQASSQEQASGQEQAAGQEQASGQEQALGQEQASSQELSWAGLTQAYAGLVGHGQPLQKRRDRVAKTVAIMMTADVVKSAHASEDLNADLKNTEKYISESLPGVRQADFPDMLVAKLREAEKQAKARAAQGSAASGPGAAAQAGPPHAAPSDAQIVFDGLPASSGDASKSGQGRKRAVEDDDSEKKHKSKKSKKEKKDKGHKDGSKHKK